MFVSCFQYWLPMHFMCIQLFNNTLLIFFFIIININIIKYLYLMKLKNLILKYIFFTENSFVVVNLATLIKLHSQEEWISNLKNKIKKNFLTNFFKKIHKKIYLVTLNLILLALKYFCIPSRFVPI